MKLQVKLLPVNASLQMVVIDRVHASRPQVPQPPLSLSLPPSLPPSLSLSLSLPCKNVWFQFKKNACMVSLQREESLVAGLY